MQPNRNPTDWQQPTEQPSQAPYAVPSQEEGQPAPVVTITPDTLPQAELATVDASTPPTDEPTPVATSSSASDTESQAEEAPADSTAKVEEEPVRWQATEYIHHERNAMWFVIFAVIVVLFTAAAIFLIQSITFAILVPVMAAALLVYTQRPPRVLDYTLSRQGLHINDHLYPFALFKSFGVVHDGSEYSVMLVPIQRFKPGVSVYFPEEAGEAIVDMLGTRLPMQELHLDMVDKLLHKLRL